MNKDRDNTNNDIKHNSHGGALRKAGIMTVKKETGNNKTVLITRLVLLLIINLIINPKP